MLRLVNTPSSGMFDVIHSIHLPNNSPKFPDTVSDVSPYHDLSPSEQLHSECNREQFASRVTSSSHSSYLSHIIGTWIQCETNLSLISFAIKF
jgi:hypothetical protein